MMDARTSPAGLPPLLSVPKLGPQRRAWLEQRLPEAELKRWPRTKTGHLSTKSDDLARLADRPEIAALLKVDAEDKKLRDFGHKLIELVNPITGRIHPSWMPCAAKTGRFACSHPNMQQRPKKERHAIIAPPSRLFVIADYSQIELRIVAELAGEDQMRAVFASGGDLHRVNAAWFASCSADQVSEDERSKAKAMSLARSSARARAAWCRRRGAIGGWCWRPGKPSASRQPSSAATRGCATGSVRTPIGHNAPRLLRSIRGRPLKAGWEYGGQASLDGLLQLSGSIVRERFDVGCHGAGAPGVRGTRRYADHAGAR